MNTVDSYLRKFQELLRELFQFDCQDLDFGIYRVLNYKRKQVEGFINERLPQIVTEAFAQYAAADRVTSERELEQKRQEIVSTLGATAFDPAGQLAPAFRGTPLGRQFLELEEKAKAGRVAEELQASVYNDLYTFFSRYYEDGDIFSRPRRGKVEIPFTGHEDVVLHWANRDQYYIKTGEQFKSYRFNVDVFAVEFALRNVATERNDNRGEKRYFVLAAESPVTFDDATKTLKVFLEYRPLTDQEKITYGKTEQQKPQDKLNLDAGEALLKRVKEATLKAHLAKPLGEDKPSLLLHHLTRFTRKNTTDFFIHKDLRGFLTRELDDFLKTEVIRTDELLAAGQPDVTRRTLLRAQAVRRIAGHIIDFLAQIEDFQKKLFEKRKFVVRTEYCITLDRLPEALWDEVLQNKAQMEEWRQFYALDDMLKQAKKKHPDRDFLKAHDKLVVDTCHFPEDFKWRLLRAFDDLDAALDGLLIKSENFQALTLLVAKYTERVKCIYIDPPYNTGSDEFIYRDNYQHACWLSMMSDRLAVARDTLRDDGVIFVSIDDNEVHNLKHLMDMVHTPDNFEFVIEWQARKSVSSDALLSYSQNHILLYAKDKPTLDAQKLKWRLPMAEEREEEFSNPDNDPRGPWKLEPFDAPEIRPNLEYPIVNPRTGEKYYPTTGRHWRFPKEITDRLLTEGRIVFGKTGKSKPALKRYLTEIEAKGQAATTWWDDVETTTDGTKLLQAILGGKTFSNPKPVRLVRRMCQLATGINDVISDFFAGSGTTAHAVINLNREDGSKRKYILVEMGDYFETVLLPRIKKVVFCENWKDGKPTGGRGVSNFLKYHILEQYEDALNNLEFPHAKEGELALQEFGDEYLLRYMLEFETAGSPSLLALDRLRHPFAYKLKVQEGDEIVECAADLVETFNYLLGLDVRKLREMRDGERLYRVVLGHSRNGKSVVVVWRDLEGLEDNKEALQKDRQFIENKVLPTLLGKGKKPDRLLVNGTCVVEGVEAIEPEFHRLMFAPVG